MRDAPMEIRWTTVPSVLGTVLLAGTTRGVCAVMMAAEEETLLDALRRRFPAARLQPGGADLGAVARDVAARIADPSHPAVIPLDLHGTAFQRAVWEALRTIPPGSTVTYAELAATMGRAEAARAVGAACGANPAAVLVPCHRVLGRSGALTGYRWGLERKRWLLERERTSAA